MDSSMHPADQSLSQLADKVVWRHIADRIGALDACRLAATCRSLAWLATDNVVWQRKYTASYGDLEEVQRQLTRAGVELAGVTSDDASWWERYAHRFQIARDVDCDTEQEAAQAEDHVTQARDLLSQFRSSHDPTLLQQACIALLSVLTNFPRHVECYHLLAFICFVLNAFEPALVLLQLGHAHADEPEEIALLDELEQEIRRLMEQAQGDELAGDLPLLDGHQLSTRLSEVLSEIFGQFDIDKDGYLSVDELNTFIQFSNGQPAPEAFLHQFIQRYGEHHGRLTLDGFLEFFLEQTLDDPAETRADIAKHGWDPRTLQRLGDAQ